MTKSVANRQNPLESNSSPQFDLFTSFVTNDRESVSNTVEFWESIPKYFFTPAQCKRLRTDDGLAKPYHYDYQYKELPCSVKIQPALIEQEDGTYKAFFPSVTEELVEEALKKIFTNQQYGLHNPKDVESWVRFSLSMIKRELKNKGRARSIDEIKHAIDVMSLSIIRLFVEEKEVWKGSILQDLITVNRDEYMADTKSQHMARLPLFISHAINTLEYRQFNYNRLMELDTQLARWLYKQLVNRFTQANYTNNYHCMYSAIERDSKYLQQGEIRHNRKKVISALDEMKTKKVLMGYEFEDRKEGRSIVDVKYILSPSPEFIADQKAANKRASDSRDAALKSGCAVDNSKNIAGMISTK